VDVFSFFFKIKIIMKIRIIILLFHDSYISDVDGGSSTVHVKKRGRGG
jgi:hypothetical protein